ncbi:DUF6090 family protein [Psychroserpens sp. MEBiC05023]
MIKFFRHIRKSFIEQNKIGKYFKYAIGEIILVVIGILIALQINNWNENRMSQKLESKYYERLLEDVREEIEILQATLEYSTQVYSHAKKATVVFENSNEIDPNPVQNLIDIYQASQLHDPNSAASTYKELIASGQINLISNEDLKTALIRYYEINWDESTVFKLQNNYRKNLRGKMPDNIQSEIRSKCGDVYIKVRNGYEVALPKTCEISIDKSIAQVVIENLKKDKSILKDLRYLIGNESAKIGVLEATKNQLEELIVLLESITTSNEAN